MIAASQQPDLTESSTWPIWLVTLFVVGFAFAVLWAWVATYYNNEKYHRLEKNYEAWGYLTRLAPVLRDWDTFGVQKQYYDYETKKYQNAEPKSIDIQRVIDAGKLQEERRVSVQESKRLTELDILLAGTRPVPDKDKDKDNPSE